MKKDRNVFYCFSPQVMALTFAAEMLLMIFVLVKKGLRSIEHRIIIIILLLLALFQLSEYGVCESLGFDNTVWARIGFVSITMLPPLGLHLIQQIRRDKKMTLTYVGYFLSLVFVVAFVFFDSFKSIGCQGNYAFFDVKETIGGAYFAYYYVLLMIGATLALMGWRAERSSDKGKALLLLVIGYSSFVLPATFIHFIFEGVTSGLPSIMCGFALIFAFLLGTVISSRIPESKA